MHDEDSICSHGGKWIQCPCYTCKRDCAFCCDGLDSKGNCICDEKELIETLGKIENENNCEKDY